MPIKTNSQDRINNAAKTGDWGPNPPTDYKIIEVLDGWTNGQTYPLTTAVLHKQYAVLEKLLRISKKTYVLSPANLEVKLPRKQSIAFYMMTPLGAALAQLDSEATRLLLHIGEAKLERKAVLGITSPLSHGKSPLAGGTTVNAQELMLEITKQLGATQEYRALIDTIAACQPTFFQWYLPYLHEQKFNYKERGNISLPTLHIGYNSFLEIAGDSDPKVADKNKQAVKYIASWLVQTAARAASRTR